MNFLMIIPTLIMLFCVCTGGRFLWNKRRRLRGFILLVIGSISLMTIPLAQREDCILTDIKTIPVPYEDYTTYHTYLYFEDDDGNVYKRAIEDMGTKNYIIGENYRINTWN